MVNKNVFHVLSPLITITNETREMSPMDVTRDFPIPFSGTVPRRENGHGKVKPETSLRDMMPLYSRKDCVQRGGITCSKPHHFFRSFQDFCSPGASPWLWKGLQDPPILIIQIEPNPCSPNFSLPQPTFAGAVFRSGTPQPSVLYINEKLSWMNPTMKLEVDYFWRPAFSMVRKIKLHCAYIFLY